jgi:hypothetical protein
MGLPESRAASHRLFKEFLPYSRKLLSRSLTLPRAVAQDLTRGLIALMENNIICQ